MRTRVSSLAIGGLLGTLALLGCKADTGDACKENDDCSGGLVCCKPGSGSSTGRGVCEMVCEEVDASVTPFDAGPLVRDAGTDAGEDAGADDAGPDDASTDDAGPDDAGMTDAGMTDAATDDAGPTDAGPTDAGPTDAGPTDAGTTDAGTTDAGTTDAST